MAHQSLYRRYRPRRFADLRGQDHIVRALKNAVAQGSEGHAYLFSGPRGTGKTSTARILAKALNCDHLVDGEPCAECESCRSIEAGNSYDLFELDAASNNGVDAMRELISRTVVGSPGRTKVYILDEVHMLSAGASNALLKTLEEPPDHVCFVLATTDPQKVLPTIRSRTQHFEFSLLSATELEDYVRWISTDAGLNVSEESVEYVVRQGRGSARDTLSALDMVVAAGGVLERSESVDEILAAIAERDLARAMIAVSDAVTSGREPRSLAERVVGALRDSFLASVHDDLAHLSDADRAQMSALAVTLGTPTITRALELLGGSIVEMRQAADPRVPLEVALIKLCDRSSDASVGALAARVEELERRLSAGESGPVGVAAAAPVVAGANASAGAVPAVARSAPPSTPQSTPPAQGPTPAGSTPPAGPAAIRAQLARNRGDNAGGNARPSAPPRAPTAPARPSSSAPVPASESATVPEAAPVPETVPVSDAAPQPVSVSDSTPRPEPAGAGASRGIPTVDALTAAMSESVLGALKGMAKALYTGGRFVDVDGDHAVFALNNGPTRERAENVRTDVEAALAAHFGRPVPLRLVDDEQGHATTTKRTRGADAPQPASQPTSESTPAPPPMQAPAPAPAPAPPPMQAPAPAPAPAPPVPAEHEEEHLIDLSQLSDADDVATTGVDKLVQAFPGAVVIEEEDM